MLLTPNTGTTRILPCGFRETERVDSAAEVVMSVLWWWSVPVGATLATIIWFGLRNRAATPEQQQRGIAELERMRSALSKPLPKQDK